MVRNQNSALIPRLLGRRPLFRVQSEFSRFTCVDYSITLLVRRFKHNYYTGRCLVVISKQASYFYIVSSLKEYHTKHNTDIVNEKITLSPLYLFIFIFGSQV